MAASYPSSVKSFTTKVDFTDTVLAEHVNSLQDEVNSVQANLGTNIRVGSGWVGAFDQVTSTWNTLKDRIANLEYGLYEAYNNRVDADGGSVISSATTSTVGLTVQSIAGQTANQVSFKTSAGTTISSVGSDAYMYLFSNKLVPVVYSGTAPTGTLEPGTVWVDSSQDVPTGGGGGAVVGAAFSEFLLIGA